MAADALALVELTSVAGGLRALDLLVKRAPVDVLEANLVEPGKFLILFAGGVAEVQESYTEACDHAADQLISRMILPMVHADLLRGLRGHDGPHDDPDTLGVIEGTDVAGTVHACDRSLKDADVMLTGVRLTGGLGGRAYYVVSGAQHDVQASIDAGRAVLDAHGALHRTELIARPHPEMVRWLLRPAPFSVASQEA